MGRGGDLLQGKGLRPWNPEGAFSLNVRKQGTHTQAQSSRKGLTWGRQKRRCQVLVSPQCCLDHNCLGDRQGPAVDSRYILSPMLPKVTPGLGRFVDPHSTPPRPVGQVKGEVLLSHLAAA